MSSAQCLTSFMGKLTRSDCVHGDDTYELELRKRESLALIRLLSALLTPRPGSKAEAERVAGWLEDMGIQASVETMDWERDDPARLTNFELEARVRRYRHLGIHAKERKIHHLFTGHHKDDQIETLLMRMIRGSNPSLLGLCGMQETSPIPECASYRGMRNLEPSRPLTTLLREAPAAFRNARVHADTLVETRVGQVINTGMDWIRGLEHGGIKIHRPLLVFSKEELIATCLANEIPFITDKTNYDPSFTQRNAIRSMRKEELPRALQPSSLLKLAETARQTKIEMQARALDFLRHVSVLAFDFRSGTADIRLPRDFAPFAFLDRNAASIVVAQLASLVSPVSLDAQQTLAPSSIVEQFAWASQNAYRGNPYNRPAFQERPIISYGDVRFQSLPRPDIASTVWQLSRAPMTTQKYEESKRTPIQRIRYPEFPPRSDIFADNYVTDHKFEEVLDLHSHGWSKWLLWDHRFWIRTRLEDVSMFKHVEVRAYQKSDVEVLRDRMSEKDFGQLIDVLQQCAPGKIRFTLPVLTVLGEVVAFPTLFRTLINQAGYDAKLAELELEQAPRLFFEVAYKLLPEKIAEWGSKATTVHQPQAQHSGAYDTLRHVTDPEQLRLHKLLAHYVNNYGPLAEGVKDMPSASKRKER
ncbi:putative tRNA(Ile)-lysidine synthase [Cyphellophora attinorum]|uniref:tRNA(Ile)-lysidine synthetase n=1 Tax=Cyphellophora attinorum TaxID=1664694 RepID=A0A0N1H8Y8_9EURO|nr:putative tRNA(Ile)-lysidine synthase [Phialophora attinorum]KPI38504.1 putative tRNA(Ile)-lysidine synthase [Phialophora attinorum]